MPYDEIDPDSAPVLRERLRREIEARDTWMRKFHELEAEDRMPRVIATAVVLIVFIVFGSIGAIVWHSDEVDKARVRTCMEHGGQWRENVAGHYECQKP
jgi:hypothetical protein